MVYGKPSLLNFQNPTKEKWVKIEKYNKQSRSIHRSVKTEYIESLQQYTFSKSEREDQTGEGVGEE